MKVFCDRQPPERGGHASNRTPSAHADNMWFGDEVFSAAYHPNPSAPSCVPCNYSRNTSELAVLRPAGCPCRPEQLCQADKAQQVFPNASLYCGIPRYLHSTILSQTQVKASCRYMIFKLFWRAREPWQHNLAYDERIMWQIVEGALMVNHAA